MKRVLGLVPAVAWVALAMGVMPGCPWRTPAPTGRIDVPEPIDLLLPKKVRIHPFSGRRWLDKDKRVRGLDVRIQVADSLGDATKAFGTFRFELYAYRSHNADAKGPQVTIWEVPLLDAKTNLAHWDGFVRQYRFRLRLDKPLPPHEPFILEAVFSSPFTDRLIDERLFEED